MRRRDRAAVAGFVERFASDMASAGMPRMPARVFATLLSSDDGCTAAELAAKLSASPAAISGAVRYLEQVDMVVRDRRPGERRDVYRLFSDPWYEVVASRDKLYMRWMDTLRQGVAAVGPNSPAGKRLDETLRFFDFIRVEMPALLTRWRASQQQ